MPMDEAIYFYTKTGPFFELSNFASFGFEMDGIYWPAAEHYFQAQKFTDRAYQERIRIAATPREARALGQWRSVPTKSDWDAIREQVMLNALRAKFRRPQLEKLLLSTGERRLFEASSDDFWGTGAGGAGANRLGR